MLINEVVEKFNVVANTAYNKAYQELEPELKSLAYEFDSGDVKETTFPVTRIFSNTHLFTGDREHRNPADAWLFSIVNKEYDDSVDILRRDLMRAARANNITGLDLYTGSIEAMAEGAKENPFESLLTMLEFGDASTYGTTFDGQNFFDTTHDFNNAAGTQSNLLTGTGFTLATLLTDLKAAMAAMDGFTLTMNPESSLNAKLRKLNNKTGKYLVVCSPKLKPLFNDLRMMEVIGNDGATTNTLRNTFEVVSRPFTDANDWYLLDVAETRIKPFNISMEERPKLETPEMNEQQLREHKMMTWGIEGFSYGIGYGAWWKAVMTTNA